MRLYKKKISIGPEIALLLYFALKPLYLRDSGNLQICDFVLVMLLGLLLVIYRGRISIYEQGVRLIVFFTALVTYQVFINLIWSFITGDMGMQRRSLYYVFNLIAYSACIWIGSNVGTDRVKKAIGIGSLISVIITAIGILFITSAGTRTAGFFNNPNQLGYYSLIMLTVIVLCRAHLTKASRIIILVISFWAMIVSMSKAAILSYFGELLVLMLFFQQKWNVKRVVLQIVATVLVGTAIYLLFFSEAEFFVNSNVVTEMRKRIFNIMAENDSSLSAGRGYARVGEMLEHILWGTGEGAYDRFVFRNGTEVHSTFISLLTCYGLIGFFGYVLLFIRSMGRGKQLFRNFLILFGPFLYSFTHNGVRNTLLWLILAIMALENMQIAKELTYNKLQIKRSMKI